MYMKQHILAALREELAAWEALVASMSEAQLNTPVTPSELSIKDEIAHLWVWQQRSVARIEAAQHGQEPMMPAWPITFEHESEETNNRINAWIFEANHEQPWATIHQQWHSGFLRMLQAAEAIEEKDLLDSTKYPWLREYPLAFVLLGSYDHHQEHLEKLQVRLAGTTTA